MNRERTRVGSRAFREPQLDMLESVVVHIILFH